MSHRLMAASLAMTLLTLLTLLASALVTSATPAGAADHTRPPLVDAQPLTPRQLSNQVKAADRLRAELMRSSAEVAAANSRLERLSAQANTLLALLSAARAAQGAAETEASAQRARLVRLGVEVQSALDALGQLASDSYISGGGPLGDVVAILEALTAPSADQNTDSMATVQYLLDGRARGFDQLRSLRGKQELTSARAAAANQRAAAAARRAAEAKSAMDVVIADQRAALRGFRVAQTDQIGQAAGLRGALLSSEDAVARAADRQLAQALAGQDVTLLLDESSSCGKGSASYPNGRLPATALCPLYAAPGESLSREASMAFNAMSIAYQKQRGSALCVTDGYRSYAEQVVVKLASPKLAASPGKSQHGLGLAVDLCGGVQNFANPAHLWMQRNEPWHWEFAH
jgi:hypothetical protein